MARWEFKLPDIGEGVTEGEVVQWLVKEGDVVKEDQPMVEVMTDKATVTIGAPRAGRIAELRGKAGQVVQVHSVLVVFELDAGAPAATAHANGNGHTNGTKKDEGPAATAVGDIRESLPGMGGPKPAASPVAPAAMHSAVASYLEEKYYNDKPLATPATRKAARDLGVDLKSVKPTGAQGRVTKDDVVAASHFLARGGSAPSSVSTPVAIQSQHAPVAVVKSEADERVPFVGMRRKIAAKMQQSTQTAAHFTFVEECDATALMALRQRLKPAAEQQGVKLTFLPFIVKAVVLALKRRPILNSALDETTNELVYRKSHHIGIAASTDAGLMVPVVKDAGHRSILDIAREIDRLGSDAKAGKSKPQDLSGSTFTITSLGAEGGLFATPIINFPEVGILGVHRIKERPVVKDGQIVIGHVMLLSLSFDHRIVDGHVGAAFAYDIIASLENPERMFLEMI
jgi:pyruvate dehydrogenase E2 component (dihydrolipoamide acetyltransferase)